MTFDLLIKNGNIIDSEKEISKANIGIIGEKIKYVGNEIPTSKKIIDAKGLFIFPGFVDLHSHADANLLFKQPTPKIHQGVTTEIVGNCGFSFFPITTERKFLSWTNNNRAIWGEVKIDFLKAAKDIRSYFTYAENKLCSNLTSYIGYGTLRYDIFGYKKKITNSEKKKNNS